MPTDQTPEQAWRAAIEAAAAIADVWSKTEPITPGQITAIIATVTSKTGEKIAAAIRALPFPAAAPVEQETAASLRAKARHYAELANQQYCDDYQARLDRARKEKPHAD